MPKAPHFSLSDSCSLTKKKRWSPPGEEEGFKSSVLGLKYGQTGSDQNGTDLHVLSLSLSHPHVNRYLPPLSL